MVSDHTAQSGTSKKIATEKSSLEPRLALLRARSRVLIDLLHDLRTPLMMIKSPLQANRLQEDALTADLLEQAERIQSGIERALEVLELDLLDANGREAVTNLAGTLDRYVSSLFATSDRTGITVKYASDLGQAHVRMHEAKLHHLLDTLIDRAVRATPVGGSIDVRLTATRQSDRQAVVLTVQCERFSKGSGGPSEADGSEKPDRDANAEPEGPRHRSTPAFELAIRHVVQCGGEVFETPDEWKILLPADDISTAVPTTSAAQYRLPRLREDQAVEAPPEGESILIIDDHPGTRAYLRFAFRNDYQVLEAEDGRTGLEMVRAHRPDLVISDIMMPHLDGNELCRIIKSDEVLKHIPVFLVTANSLPSVKTRSLESGADDYLVKPIDIDEARMRVRNMIRSRRELKQRFSKGVVIKPSEITVMSEDEALIKRATEVVEVHMEVGEFGVQELADELGMSARQLQRRMREVADQSPVEFIRKLRLQRAAQLLEQRYGNVSEVAYRVGFTSLSYFAKCFKEEFGESPSMFRER